MAGGSVVFLTLVIMYFFAPALLGTKLVEHHHLAVA